MNNGEKTCDLERIELSLQQKLTDEEQTALELHLDDCDDCRRRLESAAAGDDIWLGVRDSLQSQQSPPDCPPLGDPGLDPATGGDASFGKEKAESLGLTSTDVVTKNDTKATLPDVDRSDVTTSLDLSQTAFDLLIERVVNDDKTGSDWMIDLDTGTVYTPPTELDPEQNPKADTEKLKDWVRQQGIDATGIKAQGGELRFIEPVLAVVHDASWETVTQQQVRDALAEVVDSTDKAVVGDTLYACRTREGGMGVLQVVARDEDSPSVKIRYKLLSRAGSDSEVAAPALKAILNDADSGQGREAIDLDRAQLFDLPDANGWSRQQREDWLADNEIDLVAEYENNLWSLMTRGMTLNPIGNDRWDTVTATELDKALSEEDPLTNSDITVREQRSFRFHTLNVGVAAPLTFVFRTAEGSSGVLRVTEFSNESRSVTILLKLLRPLKGTAPPTEVRAPDALGTTDRAGGHPRHKLLGTWYGQFVDGSCLPSDVWCVWEFRENGKIAYTRGCYGPNGRVNLGQRGEEEVIDYKIDDQGRLVLFMPGEQTKYCPFEIRNGTIYISVDHENDFVFTREPRPSEYIQPRKASRIDRAAMRYESSFFILAARWLERNRGADGRQPVDLADLAGDEPERTLSPLGPTQIVPESYADWNNTKREAWLKDHAGLVYLPVPDPADDEDDQLQNGSLPPGHVLLFERPMADRNELFVVRVDDRGRITPRPEPISAGQLDELLKKQTGKELDAWSVDNNEATKADLSMERTSTRSVLSIAPSEPFSPQSEAELLAELNSQLPFEIQRKDFIAKEKSGTLVGWAVVGTGDQKEIAKSKLNESTTLGLLQVEALTPEFEAVDALWRHVPTVDYAGAVPWELLSPLRTAPGGFAEPSGALFLFTNNSL